MHTANPTVSSWISNCPGTSKAQEKTGNENNAKEKIKSATPSLKNGSLFNPDALQLITATFLLNLVWLCVSVFKAANDWSEDSADKIEPACPYQEEWAHLSYIRKSAVSPLSSQGV